MYIANIFWRFRHFEDVCVFCHQNSSYIPLSFFFAFYVGTVVTRWWDQWTNIPWPDNVAFAVNAYCRGMVSILKLLIECPIMAMIIIVYGSPAAGSPNNWADISKLAQYLQTGSFNYPPSPRPSRFKLNGLAWSNCFASR
jgi:hypothetical protein